MADFKFRSILTGCLLGAMISGVFSFLYFMPWKKAAKRIRERALLSLNQEAPEPTYPHTRPDRINLREPGPTKFWVGDKLSAKLSMMNIDRYEWGSGRALLDKNGKGYKLSKIAFKDGRIAEFPNCKLDSNLNGDCIDNNFYNWDIQEE